MQDPKGENVDPSNNGLNQFSDIIFSCPVVVATEPVYALARQVKKAREKRADKKAAEKERSSENAEKEKWHGKGEEYDKLDSRDKSKAPSSEMERVNKDKYVES
jgi:regulator of protease activity HflC (stomatin/prohibitin superfamily)